MTAEHQQKDDSKDIRVPMGMETHVYEDAFVDARAEEENAKERNAKVYAECCINSISDSLHRALPCLYL